MAFMAAENFEVRTLAPCYHPPLHSRRWPLPHPQDKGSISARMIQARFTNYGRFSCMAMLEFASEQDNAAAGTTNVQSARLDNPEGYASPFDRNWILYFATIFTESLQKEVGRKANRLKVNVMEFWQQQCEEPAAFRAPVPTSMWRADAERLGTTDAFGTSVEVRDFAPLVSFGSLRQLRSEGGAASIAWPEDATSEQSRQEHSSGGRYNDETDLWSTPPAI